MAYFKILGILFGLTALLKPVVFHLIPWDEHAFFQKAYSARRPAWVIPVALAGVVLVVWTWVMEVVTHHPRTLVVTILFSLTIVKALFLLVRYDAFQRWVQEMTRRNKGRSVMLMDAGVGLLGLAILVWTLFFL